MTLIVSLRVPDGIVIAGDSLSTIPRQMELHGSLDVACPQCGHQHTIDQKVELPSMPATTFSYAQKVFPFLDEYGVGTFGMGLVAGKSMYFAMRQLEKKFRDCKKSFGGVSEVADEISKYAHDLLRNQLESEGQNIEDFPEDAYPFGFQVVGYDGEIATTIEVYVGREGLNGSDGLKRPQTKHGCTVSGQQDVVQAIWGLYKKNPQDQPPYPLFSLQDAIAYADFLIQTTAAHQQFSQTFPSVGGDIDIAFVTPFDKFKWIRQKSLSGVVEVTNHG